MRHQLETMKMIFHLWKNNYPDRFNWLQIKLTGVESNTEGVGSWLEMYLGSDKYVRYTHCGSEYLGQNSGIVQFGTRYETIVDSLIIKWPSGIIDKLYNIDVDQRIDVIEDSTNPPTPEIIFKDVAAQQGINIGYGNTGSFGGGISFCDFNGDGYDDLTFASHAGEPIYFYVNDNGNFTTTGIPLINNTDGSKQVLWVDFDNDGDKDFFVTCEDAPNRLFRNDGYPNFTDVTSQVGLPLHTRATYGAVFGDADKDGWLDLYISNREIEDFTNEFYRNNQGQFEDLTLTSGLDNGNKPSFCAAFFDYDLDGWPDLYIAQDKYWCPNSMYRNEGNLTFTDQSASTGADIAIDAMNTGIGDYDNDGDFDIYVTNTPGGNALLRNNGDGSFTDVAASTGTLFNRVGWGGIFLDFDNDMDLDLYVSSMFDFPDEPNALYVNDGMGSFTEPLFATGGLDGVDTTRSFSNAFGDFDQNGLLDIVVSNGGSYNFMLWENQNTYTDNYLQISLEGTQSNKDGVGSIIEVYTNGQKQVRSTSCGTAYLAQNSSYYHFGLKHYTQADSVIVRWPSDIVDKLFDLTANQRIKIVESEPDHPFRNVSDEQGITENYGGASSSIAGGGVSFHDFDGDGWDDLTFPTENGDPILFYKNNNGNFNQIPPIVNVTCETKQVLWVDIENDGDKDLYVTCLGEPNRLFINDGSFNFTDQTTQFGLPLNNALSYGANFGDINNDGFLDLYVTNHDVINDSYTNYLYKNINGQSFQDITDVSGINYGYGYSFCAQFLDINNDGYLDLYVSDDKIYPNKLFKNLGNETFEDISNSSGAGIVIDAMNVSSGDYDNDGDLDIYVTNNVPGNVLLENQGNETFQDVTNTANVTFNRVGWAANFVDVDNDLDQDLYVVAMALSAADHNALYYNLGNSTFEEYTGGLPNDISRSFGQAYGDYDNDGLIDLATSNTESSLGINETFDLWRNEHGQSQNWLKVSCTGVQSNKYGVGNMIEAFMGGNKYIRTLYSGSAYLSQNPDYAHFGMASFTQADSVIIRWPSGIVDKLYNVSANQKINVIEDSTNDPPDENYYGFTNANLETRIIVHHDGQEATWDIMGVGSGAAWIDYNNDGFQDLYVTMRTTENNKLFRNTGLGHFKDVATIEGVENLSGDGAGVAVADFNNDGFQDMYLANCNEDVLYQNTGSGFIDVTSAMGFDITDDSRGTSASWADYDNDGFLDLFVTHHQPIPGSTNADRQDKLYHNDGGTGFTDVSAALMAAGDITGASFIGGFTDFDQDGDPDLIVINDCLNTIPVHTKVFRNDGGTDPLNWNWTEVSVAVGIDDCRNGMGIAMGDYNRDGWTDIAYSNVGPAVLFENNNGIFSDVSAVAGIDGQAHPLFSWGTSFLDFDLDGWQDLHIVLGSLHFPYEQDPHPDFFYRNNGNGVDFTDVSDEVNMGDLERGRNAVMGDYDRDGDPDMFLVNYGELCVVKRNDNEQTGHHYLTIDLEGTVSNRDGIGARIRVSTPNGVDQYWEMRSGSNLGGGDALEAYFGLKGQTIVSEVEVKWPSGTVQVLTNVAVDQHLVITEPNGGGSMVSNPNIPNTIQLGDGDLDQIGYLNEQEDFKRSIQIYPNPLNSADLKMEIAGFTGESMVRIIDLQGKQVFNESIMIEGDFWVQSFNLSKLNNGIYIITVVNESGVPSTQRLVINR